MTIAVDSFGFGRSIERRGLIVEHTLTELMICVHINIIISDGDCSDNAENDCETAKECAWDDTGSCSDKGRYDTSSSLQSILLHIFENKSASLYNEGGRFLPSDFIMYLAMNQQWAATLAQH